MINNPKLINNNFVIPICGSWQFDAKFISQFKDISNEIIVVVNDLNGKKSYSSNLLLDEFSSPESDDLSEGNSNAIKPSIVSGWFNIDLYRYLSDLPKKNTKLVVYATIGNFKSNVTEIEVSVK